MRARSDLAEVLEQLGRPDEANEVKESITGFFGPEESDPWPGIRGEELLLSGRFDEAFVTLQKCYEENPDDQEILTMLIKSLHAVSMTRRSCMRIRQGYAKAGK